MHATFCNENIRSLADESKQLLHETVAVGHRKSFDRNYR